MIVALDPEIRAAMSPRSAPQRKMIFPSLCLVYIRGGWTDLQQHNQNGWSTTTQLLIHPCDTRICTTIVEAVDGGNHCCS